MEGKRLFHGMKLIFIILLMVAVNTPSRAQDSVRTSTPIERAAYVTGASLAFSLLDFVGYYDWYVHASVSYRIAQVALQAAISYFLYKKFGLPSAISFNLIWWTWCDDLGFYGWANAINPAAPWANRSSNQFQHNGITWAGWTPVGLLRAQGSVISRDVLISQAIVGFSLSMAILW